MTRAQTFLTTTAASLLLTIGITAPSVGGAAELSLTNADRVAVRASEESRLASTDRSYARQQENLARQYEATARLIARQGGDPTPTLRAAAYFRIKAR